MSRRNIVVCLSPLKRPFMIPQTRFSNSSNAPVNPEPCFACDFYCHPQASSGSTRFYVAAILPVDSCSDWPPFNVDSSLANSNAGGREGYLRAHQSNILPQTDYASHCFPPLNGDNRRVCFRYRYHLNNHDHPSKLGKNLHDIWIT